MLKYSSEASDLKPRFYRHYNDMDVYVEDEDDEAFYERMLAKVLGDTTKVGRVFGVGGKVELLRRAREYVPEPSARKKFFIADGDFDRILNRPLPRAKHVHILSEYCVENFLFERAAIYGVMQEELPRKSLKELRTIFQAAAWLENCIDQLTPLFCCFIVIQKYGLGIENVKNGVGPFIGNGIPQLDPGKIRDFVDDLRTKHPFLGSRSFDEEMASVKQSLGDTWIRRKRFICGKRFLLPLLRFEVKRHTRRDVSTESFRYRVMKNCRLHSLARLRRQMESVALGQRN